MMKKLLIHILLLIGIVSCETDPITFKGPYFVRFTETALTEKESRSEVVHVQIHNAGPSLDEDVTVFYSISGSAREGIDYEILGTRGSVVIEAGEYFGYVDVRLINNSNNILRSQDLILTLTSSSSGSLGVGQSEGGIGKQFTFTILDDCILGGTYNGRRGSSTVPGLSITSSDCVNYRLSNWDINILGVSEPIPLSFIDNGDNSITVPSQTVTAIYVGIYSADVEVSGVGSVNPVTREIFLSLTCTDFIGTFSVTLTLLPQ